MKRFIMSAAVALASAFAIVPAHADSLNSETVKSAGFSKLSEAEKAEIVKLVADKAAAAEATIKKSPIDFEKVVDAVTPTPDGMDKWLNVGERFGKMIGGAARETGVAVNEFVNTPVGLLTAGLIVWNYMGSMLTHVFGAIMILIIGFTYLRYMVNRSVDWEYTYDKERRNIFGNAIVIAKTRSELSEGAVAGFTFCGAVVIAAAMIVMFTY